MSGEVQMGHSAFFTSPYLALLFRSPDHPTSSCYSPIQATPPVPSGRLQITPPWSSFFTFAERATWPLSAPLQINHLLPLVSVPDPFTFLDHSIVSEM
ncbi:Kinesin-like protein vab-8 [Clarias magur]|uniref:Kinesin-like protein vab-8 n=1 Tax=Clarias magur TaxID=1594786 RepID=A0A8J4UFU5_CLAMG|nr:Kinesin-like protein vab-8 [Clarias magur]